LRNVVKVTAVRPGPSQ
jgi:hypothetical protein